MPRGSGVEFVDKELLGRQKRRVGVNLSLSLNGLDTSSQEYRHNPGYRGFDQGAMIVNVGKYRR